MSQCVTVCFEITEGASLSTSLNEDLNSIYSLSLSLLWLGLGFLCILSMALSHAEQIILEL